MSEEVVSGVYPCDVRYFVVAKCCYDVEPLNEVDAVFAKTSKAIRLHAGRDELFHGVSVSILP